MSPSKRILIVDDEPSIQVALEYALEADGFEITIVDDGKRAVKVITESAFDLIIMDIRMKEMDGLEALKQIRSQGIKTPAILATSHGNAEIVQSALKLGVTGFLSKPMKPADARAARDSVFARLHQPSENTFEQAMVAVSEGDLEAANRVLESAPTLDPQSAALHDALQSVINDTAPPRHSGDLFSILSYRG